MESNLHDALAVYEDLIAAGYTHEEAEAEADKVYFGEVDEELAR